MKILIIPPFGIGDNLMMLPLAYNLKKQVKYCEIHFLSSTYNGASEIVKFSPYMDEVRGLKLKGYTLLELSKFFLIEFNKLIKSLDDEDYDLVLSINVNKLRNLVISNLNSKKIIMNNLHQSPVKTSLEILGRLELKSYTNWNKLIIFNKSFKVEVLRKFNLKENQYILFNMYGQSQSRTYYKMEDLFRNFKSNYLNVAIGKAKYHETINELDLVNKTNILELVCLIDCCKLLVTVDGGPMHIAISLNKRVLGIFNSNPSNFFKPLNKAPFYAIDTRDFTTNLNLRREFKSKKNYLRDLPLNEVKNKISKILY